MLCTASAKTKYCQYLVFAIVIASYILYLIFDYSQSKAFLQLQDENVRLNIRRVNRIGIIDNIIFGGSNSLNGLSAEQMSEITGERWYNASMPGEMGNVAFYNDFMMDLATNVNSAHVSKIVYSSVLPYSQNSIITYSNAGSLTHRFGFRPNRSVFAYIKKLLANRANISDIHTQEIIYGNYGDVDNNDKRCVFHRQTFKYEKVELSSNFLVERASFLADHYGNAHIYVVLPSIYFGSATPEFSEFREIVNRKFIDDIILLAPHLMHRVSFIIQDHYPSNNFICSDGIHANPLGRKWRTYDLLSRLQMISKTQFENPP
jgi:hypothetical protein